MKRCVSERVDARLKIAGMTRRSGTVGARLKIAGMTRRSGAVDARLKIAGMTAGERLLRW